MYNDEKSKRSMSFFILKNYSCEFKCYERNINIVFMIQTFT